MVGVEGDNLLSASHRQRVHISSVFTQLQKGHARGRLTEAGDMLLTGGGDRKELRWVNFPLVLQVPDVTGREKFAGKHTRSKMGIGQGTMSQIAFGCVRCELGRRQFTNGLKAAYSLGTH